MTYTFGVKGQKRNLFEVMKTTIHQSINMEKTKRYLQWGHNGE